MSHQQHPYGGQAVIEGVMIRGRSFMATACRLPSQEIVVHEEPVNSLLTRYRWLNIPIIRGTPALIDALVIGFRSLIFSADLAMEAENQKPVSNWWYGLTIAAALVIGIGGFIILPSLVVSTWAEDPLGKNLLEGLVRIILFVGYVIVISRLPDIRRMFEYHGAEHKVVNAFESNHRIDLEQAQDFGTIHPRCGSSFILLVLVVAILVHALLGWPSWPVRILSRLATLPLVAGISYEIIRLAGSKRESLCLRAIVAPGLWLQRLTTRQPTQDQMEVAERALQAVVSKEQEQHTVSEQEGVPDERETC